MPIRQPFPNDDEFLKALRDWFAGQALAAMAVTHPERTARDAYEIADAMIAERENRWHSG